MSNPFHRCLKLQKDRVARARIRVRLNRLRLGNFGDCKPVGKGVNELRVDYGPPGYRVYFGKSKATIVILLCGGSKKSQSKDIQLDHAYWADLKGERNEKGNRKILK